MGFVTNQDPDKPKSNLTDAEQRGKGWILEAIRQQKIFVTTADKGGATLILDYSTVMETVGAELNKPTKFTKLAPFSNSNFSFFFYHDFTVLTLLAASIYFFL